MDAFFNKAIALDSLQRDIEAIEYYNMALERDPNYADALIDKGVVLHELSNYQEAINSYGDNRTQ